MGGDRHPLRISAPAAASLLVNGLIVAALFGLGLGQVRREPESSALKVITLAVLKGVEDGKEEAAAAKPVVVAVKPAPAPPPPIVEQAATVILPASPASTAAIAVTPPVVSAAPSQVATPAAAEAPARRGVTDGLDVTAPPGSSRGYAAKVRSWLYAHKIYPRRARMRHEEGMVRVRFVIDRAGVLIEGVVLHGSGNFVLDEEAAAMMRRASPYPKVPADIPGERIEFVAPVEFTLPV